MEEVNFFDVDRPYEIGERLIEENINRKDVINVETRHNGYGLSYRVWYWRIE